MTDGEGDGTDPVIRPGRSVGITGLGTYVPEGVVTGAEIAAESGVPETVVVEKMGVSEKRVPPDDDDHASDMSVAAAERALDDAGIEAPALDLVCYHGSEYKDHVVWSAAADVAERLGATEAYAAEQYALCAGAPIALRGVAAQIRVGDVDRALLVAASRESDLVDYDDEDASFMFNFGSGAGAFVVEADPPAPRRRATVRGHAAATDGSFSRDVVMPAGGTVEPPSHESVAAGRHTLTVPDHESMKQRLGEVSAPTFLSVADEALTASGYDRSDLDFVALTHMKRSFHSYLLGELGVDEAGSYYLDEFGHVQSVDQALAVERGVETERIRSGDVVLFLAAGTGYTWAASVIEWS